ncbi:hypothetical protein GCM10027431_12110 [Lysobacter rhizosphaerae]
MKPLHIIAIALLSCMPLVACSNTNTPPPKPEPSASAPAPEANTALGRVVQKEIRQAREKLATENVSVGSVHVRGGHDGHSGVNISTDDNDNLPKAEITPKGDLLIEGKAVAINAEQRALLMEYRAHIIGIAESGMDIGMQGADLAAKAVGEAFKGIFSGKSEQDIEKSVEAQATGIKMAAAKLCGRLPDMMASQQKVAAAVPEFKPYATMTKEDIEDCFEESKQQANSSMNAAERAAAAATEANTQTKAATKAPTKSN